MVSIEFTIGNVVQLLREQKNLKQGDFIPCSRASVNRLEKGRTRTEPETLRAIAERLGVTVEEIHDCVSILNGALKAAEPVDSARRSIHKMLDDVLDAGEPYSGAMKLNIESAHEKLDNDRAKAAAEAKKEAKAG